MIEYYIILYIYMIEYYLSIKKQWSIAICDNINGLKKH